jgi:penicillin-binding protein A
MRARNVCAATLVLAVCAAACVFLTKRHLAKVAGALETAPNDALAKVTARDSAATSETPSELLAGLDLTHIGVDDDGATAPLASGRTARLTLDPELQRTAVMLLEGHHLPEAAIVMLDTSTGQVLAYANHVEDGPARDLCAEATAPAASVFKIVTGAALVEHAGLGPDTRQCYSGGEQRLHASDLVDDASRDKWCVTLAGAMGRSVNAVFARLAQRHLKHDALENVARSFGFGERVPFDVAVDVSKIELPNDALGFARTAAGFWNTTLSPLEAALISTTVARGGEVIRPTIVREVVSSSFAIIAAPPTGTVLRRAVSRDVADAVTTMMEHTVSEGTSYRAFHDPSGTAFVPGVAIAGKTGTLTDAKDARLFTWFTGFAPSRPLLGVRQVAVAVLVVNKPAWRVKANVIAREMLRAHFAAQNVHGVSRPLLAFESSSAAHTQKHETSTAAHRGSRPMH